MQQRGGCCQEVSKLNWKDAKHALALAKSTSWPDISYFVKGKKPPIQKIDFSGFSWGRGGQVFLTFNDFPNQNFSVSFWMISKHYFCLLFRWKINQNVLNPCTELWNVNSFTRSKTFKPNFTRRKARKSRQFWHLNWRKLTKSPLLG